MRSLPPRIIYSLYTTGLPNPGNFPYDTLEAQVALPDRFEPTPNEPTLEQTFAQTSLKGTKANSSSHMTVPHSSGGTNLLKKIDLTTALQYGLAQGYPPLYYFVRQFTRNILHPNIPYKHGADIILTTGSTDGFSKTIEALSNPWSPERDWVKDREGIIVEEFCYMNPVQTVKPSEFLHLR